jgi:hypothetical protein
MRCFELERTLSTVRCLVDCYSQLRLHQISIGPRPGSKPIQNTKCEVWMTTIVNPNRNTKVLDLFTKVLDLFTKSKSITLSMKLCQERSIHRSVHAYSKWKSLFQDWWLRHLSRGTQPVAPVLFLTAKSPILCLFLFLWVPNRSSSRVRCPLVMPELEWWFLSCSWSFEWPEHFLFHCLGRSSSSFVTFLRFLCYFWHTPREKVRDIIPN